MKLSELLEKVEILDKRSKELQCCSCSKIKFDAVKSASCGHLFCEKCTDLLFLSGKGVCPVDDIICDKNDFCNVDDLELKLLQLRVACPNKSLGCNFENTLVIVKEHVINCEKSFPNSQQMTQASCNSNFESADKGMHFSASKFQICPQGCGEEIRSDRLIIHLQSECSHRQVPCPHCSASVVLAELDYHINECDTQLIHCPYKCGEGMFSPSQMMQHSQLCKSWPFKCKFFELGCQFQDSKDEIWKHEQDITKHVDLLLNFNLSRTAAVNFTIAEMNANLQELRNDNQILRRALDENNDFLHSIIGQTEKLAEKVLKIQNYLKISRKFDKSPNKSIDEIGIFYNIKEQLEKVNQQLDNLQDNVQAMKLDKSNDQKDKIREITLPKPERHNETMKSKLFPVNDGIFIWKIRDFERIINEAKVTKKPAALFSDSFYTHNFGYKMCLSIFPYGRGYALGSHFSFYIVVLKGPMDQILRWPLRCTVTLTLLDQKEGKNHISSSFLSPPNEKAFQRPIKNENPVYGYPEFAPIRTFLDPKYLLNDTIYLKAVVKVCNTESD